MICDLSLEALLRFARHERRSQIGPLNIPCLSAEHLSPMVEAGWLTQTKGPADPRRSHSPFYEITDTGHKAIKELTFHLRRLLP